MLTRRCLQTNALLTRAWMKNTSLIQSFTTAAVPAYRKGKPVEKKEEYDFDAEVARALFQVHKAVEPLTKMNEGFQVHLVPNQSLTIETPRGKYRFYPERDRKILTLVSYFSGFHNYYFDIEDKLWLSDSDKHDMRGLITRDIMRHWNGMPHFD